MKALDAGDTRSQPRKNSTSLDAGLKQMMRCKPLLEIVRCRSKRANAKTADDAGLARCTVGADPESLKIDSMELQAGVSSRSANGEPAKKVYASAETGEEARISRALCSISRRSPRRGRGSTEGEGLQRRRGGLRGGARGAAQLRLRIVRACQREGTSARDAAGARGVRGIPQSVAEGRCGPARKSPTLRCS